MFCKYSNYLHEAGTVGGKMIPIDGAPSTYSLTRHQQEWETWVEGFTLHSISEFCQAQRNYHTKSWKEGVIT